MFRGNEYAFLYLCNKHAMGTSFHTSRADWNTLFLSMTAYTVEEVLYQQLLYKFSQNGCFPPPEYSTKAKS